MEKNNKEIQKLIMLNTDYFNRLVNALLYVENNKYIDKKVLIKILRGDSNE